jgi:hypothetical protein
MPDSMRFCPAYHQSMIRTGGASREAKTAGTRLIARLCEMLNLPFCLNRDYGDLGAVRTSQAAGCKAKIIDL